jgi:hypothetical protein
MLHAASTRLRGKKWHVGGQSDGWMMTGLPAMDQTSLNNGTKLACCRIWLACVAGLIGLA